jgi:hypothetical protein
MNRLIPAGAATAVLAVAIFACASPASATPTVPHNPQPPAGIGTGKVIVVRPHRVDLVSNRKVVRVVPLPGGPVRLDTVIQAIRDPRWASYADGVATLTAALMQRPHTTLTVGAPVTAVRLVDSEASPAYLTGSSATVVFSGVTVTSGAGAGTAAVSAHRPYIRYVHSDVTLDGSTFAALGSDTVAAVTVASDSTLAATGAVFRDNSIGLAVKGPGRTHLTRITATGNTAVGVRLDHTAAVTLDGLTASDNGTGLRLSGNVPGVMAAVVLRHNDTGVVLAGVTGGATFGPLWTDDSRMAGVDVVDCPSCRIQGLTSVRDHTGVAVRSPSAGATVRDSLIRDGSTGVSLNAPGAALADTTITGVTVGVQVGQDAGNATITDARISGVRVGLNLKNNVDVTASTVSDSAEAVRVGAHSQVRLIAVHLRAHVLGLRVAESGRVDLVGSVVDAPLGSRGEVAADGDSTLPPLPLRWLGAAAVVALIAALSLESLRRLRERREDRGAVAPDHVTNTA